MNKISFGTGGWRAIIGEDFICENVRKVAQGLVQLMEKENKKDKIKEELADVLNYCILMADACGLDLDEIIQKKVKRNSEKYPVELAFGNKAKYTELEK